MGRKKVLEKRMQRLENKKQELAKRALESNDANEVRSLNEKMQDIIDELSDIKEEIAAIEEEEGKDNQNGNGASNEEGNGDDDVRGMCPSNMELRGGNPMATYIIQNNAAERNDDPFATMEYRQAFKTYVQQGKPIPDELRAAGDEGTTIAEELGMIIPTTILNEFIKEVSKVRGNIYSKVRKLSVKGGVKIPISKLGAQFKWIAETEVSKRTKAGEIKEYIEFSYNIGEIRVSTTLLASIVSLPVFESEVVNVMMEAYLEAMDKSIISGTGTGQPLGITKDKRVKNVITFTEEELSNWKTWREKLFKVIPLKKRGLGEFMFPASTVEQYLMTMSDDQNRPLWKDPDNAMSENGTFAGKFFGRNIEYVEPDVIADFETAQAGDIIGIYWVPTDYIINTNMQFGMKRYFDEETNEYVNKALTIVDGKIADTSGCYLLKKA